MNKINRQDIENFYGNENILCAAIMMDTCHHIFVQAHRLYNTKSKSQCEPQTLVNMRCPCRFIDCDKCTILMGDVDNAYVSSGGIWVTSVPSSQWAMNLIGL